MLANRPRAGLATQTLGGVYSGVSVIPELQASLRGRAKTVRNRLTLHGRPPVWNAPHIFVMGIGLAAPLRKPRLVERRASPHRLRTSRTHPLRRGVLPQV